jgi:hypothetical protein
MWYRTGPFREKIVAKERLEKGGSQKVVMKK